MLLSSATKSVNGVRDMARKKEIVTQPVEEPTKKVRFQDLDERTQVAALRVVKISEARKKIIPFAELMFPSPVNPDDVRLSRYVAAYHHRVIAERLEMLERGEISRLIINCPPRMGKSELVSRSLMAWAIGRRPESQLMMVTYNQEYAESWGKKFRDWLQHPAYRQIFPGTTLDRHNKSSGSIGTEQGGLAVFAGVQGGVTGKGADCLCAGTMVETTNGKIAIEDIVGSGAQHFVQCVDTDTGKVYTSPVIATHKSNKGGIYELRTVGGKRVLGTADHRVYTRLDGYKRLGDLSPGDELVCIKSSEGEWEKPGPRDMACCSLCSVWESFCKTSCGGCESDTPWTCGLLLLKVLRTETSQFQEHSEVRVWESSQEIRKEWSIDGGEVLRFVPGVTASCSSGCENRVSRVRNVVLPKRIEDTVLFSELRGLGTFKADDRSGELALQGWKELFKTVLGNSTICDGERRLGVCCMWPCGRKHDDCLWSNSRGGSSSPHRREPSEQLCGELGGSLSELPHGEPQIAYDTVSLVAPVCGEKVDVYDIQVEGFHNFFANEILVHNCLIIDDPIKNAEEAGSQTTRDKVWEAFQSDLKTRLMPGGRMCIMHTRWHPDDLIGRLTDPENDYYDEQEAAKWHVIKLPALLTDPNTGEKEAIPLWPEMEVDGRLFGWNRDYFLDIKRQNARTYWALYQQEPTVEDGDYFKREWFKFYTEAEKPKNLKIYAASDHAISSKQGSDYTVIAVVGIDDEDNIYVLDIDQRRMDAEAQVDSMLLAMKRWKPITWFAEKGHITQSIGPFLRKRMLETKTYINVQEMTPVKDKVTRSQSLRGRMSMGKVFFPKSAHWFRDVESEFLKFPNSSHDDIVDALSWVGIGLGQFVGPSVVKPNVLHPKTGTLAWVKWSSDQERKYQERQKSAGGL